jgi:hypothetical protein
MLLIDLVRFLVLEGNHLEHRDHIRPDELLGSLERIFSFEVTAFGDIRKLVRRRGRFLIPLLRPLMYPPAYFSILCRKRS